MKNDDSSCPFSLEISDCEMDSLDWLFKTLRKIGNNPESENRDKARIALLTLAKIVSHQKDMHSICHELEDKIDQMDSESSVYDYIVEVMSRKSSKEGVN